VTWLWHPLANGRVPHVFPREPAATQQPRDGIPRLRPWRLGTGRRLVSTPVLAAGSSRESAVQLAGRRVERRPGSRV